MTTTLEVELGIVHIRFKVELTCGLIHSYNSKISCTHLCTRMNPDFVAFIPPYFFEPFYRHFTTSLHFPKYLREVLIWIQRGYITLL